MQKAAVICCVFLSVIAARAQQPVFKWVTGFGSNEFVYSAAVVTDPNGNLYTLGYFENTHDFDPGIGVYQLTSQGSFDVFIVKTDPGGNFVWAKSIGGVGEEVAFSMVRDINGDFYISGRFRLTADFDPGTAAYNRTAVKFQDMFICKLDAAGNFLWVITIPGLTLDNANYLSTDNDGNIYMTGNFTGTVDFDPGQSSSILVSEEPFTDVFILKLDGSGNFKFVKQVQIEQLGFVFDIAVDSPGNVYITGNFRGTVDFDPGAAEYSVTSKGDLDAWILKLDEGGIFQWVKTFGSPGMDDGTSIDVDNAGNVYATGDFSGTVDFDPGPGVFNLVNTGGYVVPYILKLDASGNLIWARVIDNSFSVIMALAINNSGDVFVTGHFRETIDFDPGITTDDITANETDMFIAKFNTDGIFEWSQQVTGPGNDYGLELTVDEYENIFTTGLFHETADFDPGIEKHELTSTGQGDVYILKTGACANKPVSSLVESTCSSFTLNDRTYTTTGTYTQTIINASGCDSTITLNLTITQAANSSITKSICQGESFEGYSAPGTYTDTYTTSNGCDSTRTLTLSVLNKPQAKLGEDMYLCKGDSLSLYPGLFNSYTWQDGSRGDRLVVRGAGMYSVTVQDACGISSDAIVVKYGPCGVFFPSAFSPNNDGVNDIFTTPARNDFFNSYHLIIYNRWGQKIFESKDPTRGWDGKVNGVLQAAETYIWTCTFTQRGNGMKDTKNGAITLLR